MKFEITMVMRETFEFEADKEDEAIDIAYGNIGENGFGLGAESVEIENIEMIEEDEVEE